MSREEKVEMIAQIMLRVMDKFTQVQIETRDILSRLVDKKEGEVSSSGSHQEEKRTLKDQMIL